MYEIDPSRKDLVEEFRKTPVGHHSPALQKLMNRLRAERFPGKHVLICTKPYKEWRLARLTGVRGEAPEVVEGAVYTTVAEAEWAGFKIRWKAHTGEDLD